MFCSVGMFDIDERIMALCIFIDVLKDRQNEIIETRKVIDVECWIKKIFFIKTETRETFVVEKTGLRFERKTELFGLREQI